MTIQRYGTTRRYSDSVVHDRTVYLVEGAQVLHGDITVLVRDGRILAIGPDVSVPANASVVSAWMPAELSATTCAVLSACTCSDVRPARSPGSRSGIRPADRASIWPVVSAPYWSDVSARNCALERAAI